ncbi:MULTISPECIES: hypothetical protein [Nostoc]|nr:MULTISPECIES: hypothetical protein [Nostoc]
MLFSQPLPCACGKIKELIPPRRKHRSPSFSSIALQLQVISTDRQ